MPTPDALCCRCSLPRAPGVAWWYAVPAQLGLLLSACVALSSCASGLSDGTGSAADEALPGDGADRPAPDALDAAGESGAAPDAPALSPTPRSPAEVPPLPELPAGGAAPRQEGTSPTAPGEATAPPDTGPPAQPASNEPDIPRPDAPCPTFRSGSQRILDLDTEIVAGTPRETKGPLLLTWHGTGGSGRQALLQLPQSVQRDIMARGGLIIAPSDNGLAREGTDVTFVLGVWYDTADLEYADHIVGCAVERHNVDPRQIYVTGCSAGGLMAGVMALKRSSYVAATAPNSGGLAAPLFTPESALHAPATMAMHGGATDNVIVNFGDTTRALTEALTPLGAFVVECNHGSGHCGAPASLHERAWEFMLAHPFGTAPSPYAGGLPASFPPSCQIQ